MKNIFLNSEEKRLRAGWRILIFLIFFFIFTSLIFVIRPLLGDDLTKREFLKHYGLIIVAISALGATVSTIVSRRLLDKKSFLSLGLTWDKQAIKDLIFGFLLSFIMAGTFFLLLIAFDLIEYTGLNFQEMAKTESFDLVQFMSVLTIGSLGLLLLEHILVGYWEELVFRGYLFQNMIDGLGLITSIVISCLLYGLIHAANPNATILSSAIIIGFGFLRLYGYLSTKMLWLSMGMHIGWNFFQGPIFGFAASGHESATLITHSFSSEKDFLTGGAFGPEGSILILPILVITLVAMRWYASRYYRCENKLISQHV